MSCSWRYTVDSVADIAGVSHRGPVCDAADRARAAAADSDRVRSSFGCHQQIA
jgi:hypothetical protein